MSVNNDNAPVSLDNPFADLSSLKDANLTERETAILSKCNYKDLKPKWTEGLNNISNTYMRNVKEVKESFFCHLGNVLGFANSEPLKEVHKVFSNFDLFDRYVRNDISQGTYKKIAKANPAYFDKVIKHLEDSAKELDTKADARIGTFCSSSTGYALAKAATRFRDTADYLKRMMHGDDAAKPGNNNANPGADHGQPTIINHYHNHIGHIGDINIGHLGDNNFHNKGGNMGVMFKESSNGVPHTGFKSERPALESPNSFYSPSINGKRFLNLTPIQVAELALEGNKDKGKKLEPKHNEELMFEAHKPLPQKEPESIKQQVDSINLGSEEPQQLYKTKGDLKIYKEEEPAGPQQPQAPKKAKNINSVQPKQTPIEQCNSKLRQLRTMFFANWDEISKDLENRNNTKSRDTGNFEDKVQFFNKSAGNFGNEITPEKVIHEIKQLQRELGEAVGKKQSQVDGEHWSNLAPLLSGIELMLSKDKTTAEEEIKDKREKSENSLVDKQDHGIGFEKEISEGEQNDAQAQYRKGNCSANKLLKETLETIEYIRQQAELKKKNSNPFLAGHN